MGDGEKAPLRLQFNPKVRLEFHGSTITSDAGLQGVAQSAPFVLPTKDVEPRRVIGRDSPDKTDFPGCSFLYNAANYNPAFLL